MNTPVVMAMIITFLTHMGLLMCHPATWRNGYSPAVYLPGPQHCPDTGRTVCAAVDYYPTDRIFSILTNTRSQGFNISSLFVDERNGDAEPNISQLVIHPPYYQNNYATRSDGRYSSAGRVNEAGAGQSNIQSGNAEFTQPVTEPTRWRQVPIAVSSRQHNGGSPLGQTDSRHQRGSNYISKSPHPQTNGQTWTDNSRLHPELQGTKPETPASGVRNSNGGRYGPLYQQKQVPVNGHSFTVWRNRQPKGQDRHIYHPNKESYELQTPHVFRQDRSFYEQRNDEETSRRRGESSKMLVPTWDGPQLDQLGFRLQGGIPKDTRSEFEQRVLPVKRARRNMDVEGACGVRSTFVPPRAALNDQSQWKYVINVPERDQRFSQVVRVDLCLREGQPCSSKLSLPFGFVSRCRQKYIKKKLLSLNPDGQGTAEDNFFIPSCCVCEIVRSAER